MNIKNSISNVQKQIEQIRTLIKQEIEKLPANSNVKPISKHCFIIQKSELNRHDNWSVEYHLFRKQYEWIIEKINTQKFDNIATFLEDLCKNGKIKVNNNVKNLHPEVVKNIKEMLIKVS